MRRRVLLVNKFYYPRGGDCVVTLNTETLLRQHGVDVAVFAMQYPQNLDAQLKALFASRVDFAGGVTAKWQALQRTMGWGNIKATINKVLDEFQPTVVHLHNVHSYLSPIVGQLAHQRGCRVVWTLHDYKLLCPRYDCLCNGKPCQLCFMGAKHHVVRHRCMKQSLPASIVAWLESKKWNRDALQHFTDVFICPSQFMADQMARGGFDRDKLVVLPNFIDPVKREMYATNEVTAQRENFYCYVGRLSPEKGLDTLLKVASKLPYSLKVAGGGPLAEQMQQQYRGCEQIQFVGNLDATHVAQMLSKARFLVIPSEWYENNPLSVIESLCAGTPVVGARIGGIPELIDTHNGVVFSSHDEEALTTAISMSMERDWAYTSIAQQARERYSAVTHLKKLLDIYAF